MFKDKKMGEKAWVAGLIISFVISIATPVLAKTINLKDIGTIPTLWIIIGVIIVLLQLIPAAILFFSFIGVSFSIVFKGRKATDEVAAAAKETIPIPGYDPIPIKNEFASD